MYQIQKKDYGYLLTFGGLIKAPEMQQWLDEAKQVITSAPKEFGVFVDMRTLVPLPAESQPLMQEGQKLFKKKGMVRSAVILNSQITKLQFVRIAKETGIYEWERYIDASSDPAWEASGMAWINQAKDPDLK